jgi:hypothetical protein
MTLKSVAVGEISCGGTGQQSQGFRRMERILYGVKTIQKIKTENPLIFSDL